MRLNVLRPTQGTQWQPDSVDHPGRRAPIRTGLCDHYRPRLQRHQEGGRGSEDVRRRGRTAAPGRAAAAAEGHAGRAAAADDAAVDRADACTAAAYRDAGFSVAAD